MRGILLSVGVLLISLSASAKSVKFSETTWDFGTIAEEGGDVMHTFMLENQSGEPMVIYNIQTSCGCTTPKYSRKPISKGESSPIEVTFDPKYRPGVFSKDIYIYNSATKEPVILKIKGDVTARVLSMQERYPYNIGDEIRIGALYTTFRAVPIDRLVQQSVEYLNLTDRKQRVEFRPRTEGTPLRLYYDEEIGAKEGSSVEIGYFVEEGRGRLADTVDIFINGLKTNRSLYIKGLIVE